MLQVLADFYSVQQPLLTSAKPDRQHSAIQLHENSPLLSANNSSGTHPAADAAAGLSEPQSAPAQEFNSSRDHPRADTEDEQMASQPQGTVTAQSMQMEQALLQFNPKLQPAPVEQQPHVDNHAPSSSIVVGTSAMGPSVKQSTDRAGYSPDKLLTDSPACLDTKLASDASLGHHAEAAGTAATFNQAALLNATDSNTPVGGTGATEQAWSNHEWKMQHVSCALCNAQLKVHLCICVRQAERYGRHFNIVFNSNAQNKAHASCDSMYLCTGGISCHSPVPEASPIPSYRWQHC